MFFKEVHPNTPGIHGCDVRRTGALVWKVACFKTKFLVQCNDGIKHGKTNLTSSVNLEVIYKAAKTGDGVSKTCG